MRLIIVFIALLCLTGTSLSAAEAVECVLKVHQADVGDEILLLEDTVTVVQGVPTTGFLLAFSVDVEVTEVDSSRTAFAVHVVTLGPPANTYSQSFAVEYGLPAHMKGIRGKAGAEYALTVLPLRPGDVDTTICSFIHSDSGTFSFNPTAHMDIHYVPNSLADFYWTTVKSLQEYEYRKFKTVFSLNLPGKFQFFLCPCPIRSVIWDDRFGQVIIPTRNIGFALYTKEFNSADPFAAAHAAVLRTFGYAPPFLSEGMAGYLSFAIFDMKELVAEEKNLPLASLLGTYDYLYADPVVADRTAATFVKFLIDSYGLGPFRDLYRAATDLNLAEKLAEQYEIEITELETQWLHYVDTLTIPLTVFSQFVEQAEAMMNYGDMLDYSLAMVDRSVSHEDSLMSLSMLKRAGFYSGDYYRALEAQEGLLRLKPTSAVDWMTLAAYEMMNGSYEAAHRDLAQARELEPDNNMIKFNLGLYQVLRGETHEARMLFTEIIHSGADPAAQIEARIMLGNILHKSEDTGDQERALTYYREALGLAEQQTQLESAAPTAHLWMGIAFLGLGDAGSALTHLESALFLETRPFYLGMINLWLGKLYDAGGGHGTARDYYGAVLAGSSAAYHQEEARRYLERPYQP